MFTATKNGAIIGLHSDVQAAAFRSAGWEVAAAGKTAPADDEALTALKDKADALGVKYHPNIGFEKLKVKVDEALAASAGGDGEPGPEYETGE